MFKFILLVFFVQIFTVLAQIELREGNPYVLISNPRTTIQGTISYSRDNKPYYGFLGIRYAKPPIRFRPPEELTENFGDDNTTIQHAIKFGARCPQKFWATQEILGDEDCLFLNIFVPSGNKRNLPVMLFIHGGRFTDGEGDTYGPDYFMDENVVLVTINYRLGALGFLTTGDSEVPGNMGLRDQALAIKWVHTNILGFTGDPSRIVIFGESAGAASVHFQMFWPKNKGLFSGVIAQSGTANCRWAVQLPHEANQHATKLGALVGCNKAETTSKKFIECLQSKSWKDLILNQSKLSKWLNDRTIPFGPVVETQSKNADKQTLPFLGQPPELLIQEKLYINVPLIVGINEDEGHLIQSAFILKTPSLVSELNDKWNKLAPVTFVYGYDLKNPKDADIVSKKVYKFYFGDQIISTKTRENLTNLYSDVIFVHGTKRTAETMITSTSSNIYLYLLTYKGEFSCTSLMGIKEYLGVTHADDLQYLFKTQKYGPKDGHKKNSKSENLSKNLTKLWVSFAETGSPEETWGNAKTWYPTKKLPGKFSMQNWYVIDSDTHLSDNLFEERMKFWDDIRNQYFVKNEYQHEEIIQTKSNKIEL